MTVNVEILRVPEVEPPVAQHYSRLQCDVKWNLWFDLKVLVVGSRSSTYFCVSSVFVVSRTFLLVSRLFGISRSMKIPFKTFYNLFRAFDVTLLAHLRLYLLSICTAK